LRARDGASFSFDLPDGGRDKFLREGLDIAKCETKVICPSGWQGHRAEPVADDDTSFFTRRNVISVLPEIGMAACRNIRIRAEPSRYSPTHSCF